MTKKDILFELIKSLTKSEKRYFKLFSSLQTGGKVYLQLFDAIDKQKEYNEKPLLKLFVTISESRREAKLSVSTTKHYLYNLILKCMQVYYLASTTDRQLKEMINTVRFLLKKELYSQAGKIAAKAKKLAAKYEKHLSFLELQELEMGMMLGKSFSGKNEKELEELYSKQLVINDTWKKESEYIFLVLKLFIRKIKTGKNREDVKYYEDIMKHPLFCDESKAITFQEKNHFYLAHSTYFQIKQEQEHAYFYIKKLVAWMEAHPHQLEENKKQYMYALHNLIFHLSNLKRYDEVPLFIEKMKSIIPDSEQLKNLLFFTASRLEFDLYIGTGQFAHGKKVIEVINSKPMNTKTLNKEQEFMLLYDMAYICFGLRNYTDANKYLNRILNESTDIRNDLVCYARILQLIIYYEKGDKDFIEYSSISAERFIKNRMKLNQLEKTMMYFFRKTIPNIHTDMERTNAFKKLKETVTKILKIPYEKITLQYFDFISWIESKIEARPFAEVVRGKVENYE